MIIIYYFSGPSQALIVNQDKSKATVSALIVGIYRFRFNVTDDGGLSASADIFINVTQSKLIIIILRSLRHNRFTVIIQNVCFTLQ